MINKTHLKLLLVDDDHRHTILFREQLSQCSTLQCELESTNSYGAEDVKRLQGFYDAVILAHCLLKSSGQQSLEEHHRHATIRTPVILLIDEEEIDPNFVVAQTGADDYLIRGQFNTALLQRTLYYAIERSHHLQELRSSQTRSSLLFSAINHSSTGIIVTDPHQKDNPIIYANPGFTQLSGYSREEVLGHNCRLLTGPQTDPVVQKQMRDAIAKPDAFSGTILNYRKDGTPFWNELKINPVYDSAGALTYFIGVQTDVTERIEAQALKNRLAAIVESSADAIYSRDFEGNITTWNRGAEELFGYTCEEIVGKSVFQIMAPENREQMQHVQQLIRTGQSVRDIESVGFCKNGDQVCISLSLAPIRDDKGEVTEIAAVARDISDNKRYQQELESSNKRITDVWESINDGFFSLDGEGCFTYINHRAETMLHRQATEVITKNIWDVFPEAVTTEFYRRYREVVETRQPVHFEEYHEALATWLEVHAYPAGDGVAVYLRDVSERRLAQNSIEELNAKLEQRVERLSVLHQIDIAISGSFDLKTILNILVSHLVRQLHIDAARVWLLPDSTLALKSVVQHGFSAADDVQWLQRGQGLAGQVAQRRMPLEVKASPHPNCDLKLPHGFNFYYGVPLMAKGHLLGVLEVLVKQPFTPGEDWVEFFEALTAQATIAIDNSQLFTQLQYSNNELFLAYDTTIEGWSRALDLRDKETEGHSLRVTELTMQIAQAMSMSSVELAHVRRGALLHDIGKMGVPDSILLKPGPLSEEEWHIMKKHPLYAYELLSPIDFLRPALDIPYCHHEKWDGSGYPRGLRGEQIPLSARLFAVVDVWDALTSDRPYRAAWTRERSLAHIIEQSGTHFDTEVVKVFLQIIG